MSFLGRRLAPSGPTSSTTTAASNPVTAIYDENQRKPLSFASQNQQQQQQQQAAAAAAAAARPALRDVSNRFQSAFQALRRPTGTSVGATAISSTSAASLASTTTAAAAAAAAAPTSSAGARPLLSAALPLASVMQGARAGVQPAVPTGSSDAATMLNKRQLGDTQQCIEYYDEIAAYMRRREVELAVANEYQLVPQSLHERSRALVLDWLVTVHYRFRMKAETLMLAANLFDRYMSRPGASASDRPQAIGAACLMIAAKVEEQYAPCVRDMVMLADRGFAAAELLESERCVLRALDFNVTATTSTSFLDRYINIAVVSNRPELAVGTSGFKAAYERVRGVALYLLETAMVTNSMMKARPSQLCAAAVALSLKVNALGSWNNALAAESQCPEPTMRSLARDILDARERIARATAPTTITRKYSHQRYGAVATFNYAVSP